MTYGLGVGDGGWPRTARPAPAPHRPDSPGPAAPPADDLPPWQRPPLGARRRPPERPAAAPRAGAEPPWRAWPPDPETGTAPARRRRSPEPTGPEEAGPRGRVETGPRRRYRDLADQDPGSGPREARFGSRESAGPEPAGRRDRRPEPPGFERGPAPPRRGRHALPADDPQAPGRVRPSTIAPHDPPPAGRRRAEPEPPPRIRPAAEPPRPRRSPSPGVPPSARTTLPRPAADPATRPERPGPVSPAPPGPPVSPTSPGGAATAPLPRIAAAAAPPAPAVAQPGGPPTELLPATRPAGTPRPPAPISPAPAGSPPPRPLAPPRANMQRAKRWYLAIAATVGVLTLSGSCGTFAYQLVQDELAGQQALAEAPQTTLPPEPRDISSREADPEPLSLDEVFPEDEIVVNPAEPPYRVLETQESEDCSVAAADAVATLLDDLGCTQVVRATLESPTEAFLVTGGVFNLATEADAEQAYDEVGPMIDEESGRFLGLLAGEGTESIVLSETRVGWDFRGHYLVYVIIARADGEPFAAADDRHAELILWDIVEVHLRTTVLDGRELPELASAAPPASAGAEEDAGEE